MTTSRSMDMKHLGKLLHANDIHCKITAQGMLNPSLQNFFGLGAVHICSFRGQVHILPITPLPCIHNNNITYFIGDLRSFLRGPTSSESSLVSLESLAPAL